ncbi:ABC transporter substrate-binding protein [Novosphingobium lentum]|uniref:ABC transporter substrate-binding protein n=1 Tax=Novosphingobium lentum TaxID=145287 RepID=UPI0008315B11|nr:ABC transporter substrate-binding protein [Novosphingobium lentum]
MFKAFPVAAAFAIAGTAIAAQATDPAIATVQSLDDGLLSIMRAGKAAGVAGRARAIGPVIDRTFDIAAMTRLSVGPSWTTMNPRDQAALVAAFRTMTVSQYARNFDGYSGERFAVSPQVETRGGDKLVRTSLASPGDAPVAISYRLRMSGGQWKVIDVFYKNAISQLATRRADFARVLATGGASALIGHLNQMANRPN